MTGTGSAPSENHVEVVTTYLEMTAPPQRDRERARPAGLSVIHVEAPPLHYYRYLYDAVGEPWSWWERRRQDDATVLAAIHDPQVEIHVPMLRGAPAGLCELDWRQFPEVELKYFGLIPEYIGQGIGGFVLDWAIDRVWAGGAERFWLHTCNFDSPQAIPVYERAGFRRYEETREWLHDPVKARVQAKSP